MFGMSFKRNAGSERLKKRQIMPSVKVKNSCIE